MEGWEGKRKMMMSQAEPCCIVVIEAGWLFPPYRRNGGQGGAAYTVHNSTVICGESSPAAGIGSAISNDLSLSSIVPRSPHGISTIHHVVCM